MQHWHEMYRHVVTAGIVLGAAVALVLPEYAALSVALNALVNIVWVWS